MLLSGCTTGVACPAIGWINSVEVRIVDASGRVTQLEACVDSACSTSGTAEDGTASWPSVTSGTPGQWSIAVDMQSPEKLRLRALGANGEPLAEETFALEWTRIGGSEECGGPMRTEPLTMTVG